MNDLIERYKALCVLMLMDVNVDKRYKWIAMDSDGGVYAFVAKPLKDTNLGGRVWYNGSKRIAMTQIGHFKIGYIEDVAIQLVWKETRISINELLKD